MEDNIQLSLFVNSQEIKNVAASILKILMNTTQPSAWELIAQLESKLGLKVRWIISDAMNMIIKDSMANRLQTAYLRDMLNSEDWVNAIRGSERPARQIESTIDALIHESSAYRNSTSFQEMIGFMANFRDYAPFNNMLVKLQNPSCSFFATQKDWSKRFGRQIKKDAHPMLILAPMHPVMLVYDIDSTQGPPLPSELLEFGKFNGEWDSRRLLRTEKNAFIHDLIQIDTVKLSSTSAGFATISVGQDGIKMRVGLHEELDEPSRYGVLLHELAHIYLGHLGGDKDDWWPSRGNLTREAIEVEAEAVAYIVSRRAGLSGSSAHYISRFLDGEATLKAISLDNIAKVAGRLEDMGIRNLGKRRSNMRER